MDLPHTGIIQVPRLWVQWQQSGWCQEQGSEPLLWFCRGLHLSNPATKTCSGMWHWAACMFTGLLYGSYHCIYQLPLWFNKINDFEKIAYPLIFHYPPDPVFSPYTPVVNRPLRYLVDKPTTPLLHLSCTSLIFFSRLIFFYSTKLKPFPICPLYVALSRWQIHLLQTWAKNKFSDKRRKFFFIITIYTDKYVMSKYENNVKVYYVSSQMISILKNISQFYVLFQPAGTFNMQNSPEDWDGTPL